MSSWSEGYVSDVDYTYGYYREMSPDLLRIIALIKGYSVYNTGEPINYCELGCGQGYTVNLLAAANPQMKIFANDFNPTQIAGARSLSSESGITNISFYDSSFEEFIEEKTLPDQFDIISLHGIYSWINEQNRDHILKFIKKKLKVGGIVYASYNVLPGWAQTMPLRHLMANYAANPSSNTLQRMDAAFEFVNDFKSINPAFFQANPLAVNRFEKMNSTSRNYLAHEYFNTHWTPFYFSDVAKDFADVKLTHIGSAHLLDHVDAINLTDQQRNFLSKYTDPIQREVIRDFIVNQQFRRDVFVKGPLSQTIDKNRGDWLDTRFALISPESRISLKVNGILGEAELLSERYLPIINALRDGPRTLRQMAGNDDVAALGWGNLLQAIIVLMGGGHLWTALPAKDDIKRRERTKAFNSAICERSKTNTELNVLASPVTGGGVHVDRITQMFLLATRDRIAIAPSFVWRVLSENGQKLVKNDIVLESDDENIRELEERFVVFTRDHLPNLKSLGIV